MAFDASTCAMLCITGGAAVLTHCHFEGLSKVEDGGEPRQDLSLVGWELEDEKAPDMIQLIHHPIDPGCLRSI